MLEDQTCTICDQTFIRLHPAEKKCKACKSSPSHLVDDLTSMSSGLSENHLDGNDYASKIDSMSKTIDLMHSMMIKMQEEIYSLKSIMKEEYLKRQVTNAPSSIPSNVPKRTFAQATAAKTTNPTYSQTDMQQPTQPSPSTNKTSHRILLKPLKPSSTDHMTGSTRLTPGEISNIPSSIEKSIPSKDLDFRIAKTQSTNNGGIVISLPSKEDQTCAISRIREKSKDLGFLAEEAVKTLPRVIIRNLPTDIAVTTNK